MFMLLDQACVNISSLLQNPARGKIPERLSAPIRNVEYVHGIDLRSPPMYLMSNVPVAWLTLPDPRTVMP